MEIRDLRNGAWFWVNLAVMDCPHLTSTQKLVYMAMATYGGFKEIRPSVKVLAKRAGFSQRTVAYAINSLMDAGLIRKVSGGGRGKSNVYDLLKADKGCKRCRVSQIKGATGGKKRVQEVQSNKIYELNKGNRVSFEQKYGIPFKEFSKLSRKEQRRIIGNTA